MDEYDDDLDSDVGEAETPDVVEIESEAAEAVPPDVSKLRRENRSLRLRLRRSELSARYGTEVVGLIPAELPIEKWAQYAEKLEGLRRSTTDTEPPAQATVDDDSLWPPSADELKMAKVAQAPPSASAYQPTLTSKEILEIGRRNPAEAARLIAAQYRGQ